MAIISSLPPRMSREVMLMQMARVVSKRGTCRRRYVGAVIARDSRVISTGYNGSPAGTMHCYHRPDSDEPNGCWRAVHAEMNAILFAARHGVATEGAEIYTTDEPCYACSAAIVNAGIVRVAFFHGYRLHEGLELLNSVGVDTVLIDPDA